MYGYTHTDAYIYLMAYGYVYLHKYIYMKNMCIYIYTCILLEIILPYEIGILCLGEHSQIVSQPSWCLVVTNLQVSSFHPDVTMACVEIMCLHVSKHNSCTYSTSRFTIIFEGLKNTLTQCLLVHVFIRGTYLPAP